MKKILIYTISVIFTLILISSCENDPNSVTKDKVDVPYTPNNNLFENYLNPSNWCNSIGALHNDAINYVIENAEYPPDQDEIRGLVVQFFIDYLDEFDSSDSLELYNAFLSYDSLDLSLSECYDSLNFNETQILFANSIYGAIDYYLNTEEPYTYFYDSLMLKLSNIENDVLNSALSNQEKESILVIISITKYSLNEWTEVIYPDYFSQSRVNIREKGLDNPLGVSEFFGGLWEGVQEVAGVVWHGVKKDARGALNGGTEVAVGLGVGCLIGGPVSLKVAAGTIAGGAAVGAVRSSTGWF